MPDTRLNTTTPGVADADPSLHDSELRFRALVTATSTAVYRMSPDWQQLRQLTGQGFLEDTFQPDDCWFEKYMLEEDRTLVLAAIAKATAERSIFELEHRVRLPNGCTGWTLSRAVPILAADGEIIEWFGAAVDVTEKHNAAARLRESEQGFKAIANSVPELVWVTDQNGQVTFFNQRWADYLGVTGEHHHMRTLAREYIHPDDVQRTLDAFAHASAHVSLFQVEHRLRGTDGHYRWFMVRANPYVDPESGRIVRWYGTSVDVHERHAAEEQLRHFNERLEIQVQAGSRELVAAEAQVRQMQKLEAIGQLTGGVAHDFNNLLTIIRNSAELLGRANLPEERRKRYLDAILDTTDRASRLTGQLLAFARKQALSPEVFEVGQRVEQIAEMLRRMIGTKIDIFVRTSRDNCFVGVDLNQFETALVNLVINARDAIPNNGRITLTVTADPLSTNATTGRQPMVDITVEDDGQGIEPGSIERIFEPFYTTKDVGKGTGLGLSQVYGFVRQSGGNVTVHSTVGQGSTFTVSLPAVGEPAMPRAEPVAISRTRRNGRVLLVEDNAQVGEFTARLLEDLGYETLLVNDASCAITQLESAEQPIDLLLTDIVMPGLSGIELGRLVRQRWPELPVVLTSGYSQAMAGEVHHGFELLKKPYSVNELLRYVERGLRGRC